MSPALAWLRRWGISCCSLVAGCLALFVFGRGLPRFSWIVGYLLLTWLLVTLLVHVRGARIAAASRAGRLALRAVDYTVQSLYHAVLLFLLPPYWAATTLSSPNVLFLALLVGLIVLATFDPWYRAIVGPRAWLGYVYFLVCAFAALNVALPLVGAPAFFALTTSAWLAVFLLTPVVRRARGWPWMRALGATAAVGIVAAVLVGAGRIAVPPAPLFVARAALAHEVAGGEPVGPLGRTIDTSALGRGLVAFTAIVAPAGLRQPVAHVWRHRGSAVATVPLTPVLGGRREGFRTYSRKSTFPPEPSGRWSVDVVTAGGQLIGRLRFEVLP